MTAVEQDSLAEQPILRVNNIEVIYDHVILVLKGVSLEVPRGGIVALLGGNGAGKTTTLKAISNLLKSERGEVTKGTIDFEGQPIQSMNPHQLVERGVIQVMEGRHCFEHLTVEENLLTGAFTRGGDRAGIAHDLEMVYTLISHSTRTAHRPCRIHIRRRTADDCHWPRTDEPTANHPVGRTIHGSCAAVGRTDLRNCQKDQRTARRLHSAGRAEYQCRPALCKKYGYILESGRIVMEGDAENLRSNEDVKEFYLGISTGGRKSFRDVKHYRRRKRWLG